MKELRELKPLEARSEVTSFNDAIDEVIELGECVKSLQNAILSFARYVPAAVVKDLMASSSQTEASIKVERRNITIFFSDIKSFTTICEQLSPSQILELLTEYFDAMEEIVSDTGGTILEYIGDAVLAVWNAPELDDFHAKHGLQCALRMQLKLNHLRNDWAGRGFPDVSIRVGVHTAEVFHGNLGSHKRLKYGVLGDGVNLASRLEELNKRYDTEVLVSGDTYQCSAVSETFLARPVDIVVVKGKSVPITLWEIVVERSSSALLSDAITEEICKLQTDAMSLFLRQDFDECCSKLRLAFQKEAEHKEGYAMGTILVHMQYGTTRSLFERAQNLVGSPKKQSWNGSEVLNEKHF